MFRSERNNKDSIHYPRVVKFVCEQDGIFERKLKEEFFKLFIKYADIKKVYLACVEYDNSGVYKVGLCFAALKEDRVIINKVSEIFKRQFNKNVHMDIIFLTESQEKELRNVCKPFYDSAPIYQ